MLDQPLDGSIGEGTKASPRLVVEVWLEVPTDEGRRLLMLRRAAAHGGFWQGVSGRVETTDATLRVAAVREVGEELGIREGYPLHDLGSWYSFQSPFSGMYYRKRSLWALLPAGTSPDTVVLSDEHVEARLTTFEEARALSRFEEYRTEITAVEALTGADHGGI